MTLDYPEDFTFFKSVIEYFGDKKYGIKFAQSEHLSVHFSVRIKSSDGITNVLNCFFA